MAQQLIVLKKEKKNRQVHPLQQLTNFANRHCSRLPYRGLIPEIIFKGTITNKTTYNLSYCSGPVLNNELFFANGKILAIFVNQTKLSLIIGGTQIITNK